MNPVSIDELVRVLDRAAEGEITRSEAAGWAQSRVSHPRQPSPFPPTRHGRLADLAMAALSCADMSEQLELQNLGEPYFIRSHDLREWSLTLRGKDWIGRHPQSLHPKRLHQIRPAEVAAATMCIAVEDVVGRLGISSLRGIDDLDYFEHVLFDDRQGQQIFLDWYKRSTTGDATLWVEETANPDAVLRSLLRLLRIDDQVVSWRCGPDASEAVSQDSTSLSPYGE